MGSNEAGAFGGPNRVHVACAIFNKRFQSRLWHWKRSKWKINRNVSIVHVCIVHVHVCRIQIFSVLQKGGGGLACAVLYEHVCIWRNSYHFIHGTWIRQIGIRIYLYYLWLIQCTLSHNSWTDRQYFKQGTEKHRQSTLWWFWYWFFQKKIQQSCACISFRRRHVAVKILVYTRF